MNFIFIFSQEMNAILLQNFITFVRDDGYHLDVTPARASVEFKEETSEEELSQIHLKRYEIHLFDVCKNFQYFKNEECYLTIILKNRRNYEDTRLYFLTVKLEEYFDIVKFLFFSKEITYHHLFFSEYFSSLFKFNFYSALKSNGVLTEIEAKLIFNSTLSPGERYTREEDYDSGRREMDFCFELYNKEILIFFQPTLSNESVSICVHVDGIRILCLEEKIALLIDSAITNTLAKTIIAHSFVLELEEIVENFIPRSELMQFVVGKIIFPKRTKAVRKLLRSLPKK